MSLILEALRKSEQQRRLGESPTLVSESAWATRRMQVAPTRRGRWLWLLLIVVLAAAAAAWYFGRPSLAVIDPTLQQPVTAAAPLPASTPSAVENAPPATISAAPAPQAAVPIAEPIAAPASDPMLAATGGRELVASTAPEPQAALASKPQAPPPATPAVPDPATAIAPPSAPPAAAVPDSATLPPVAAPAAAEAPPPAAIPTPTAPIAQGDVPYFYELPLATRQALPAMQVTMHVWNADPARRFVILDGVRASEGEAAGAGMTVLEIRRDGVVLDFRGAHFLLPNGGL